MTKSYDEPMPLPSVAEALQKAGLTVTGEDYKSSRPMPEDEMKGGAHQHAQEVAEWMATSLLAYSPRWFGNLSRVEIARGAAIFAAWCAVEA